MPATPSPTAIARRLADAVDALAFDMPVAFVYNPLRYARRGHERYLESWAEPSGAHPQRALLVGMNPGPWGMAQTGVPFGAISLARDWLGIEAAVDQPPRVHPQRPVEGFACRRDEVSGQRLWGWAKQRFGTPQAFFERFFVANYCPLLFLDQQGRNLTPDRLKGSAIQALETHCDAALRALAQRLGVARAIGVGLYAERCARRALDGLPVTIGRIPHPSPASPQANRGWAAAAERALRELGALP